MTPTKFIGKTKFIYQMLEQYLEYNNVTDEFNKKIRRHYKTNNNLKSYIKDLNLEEYPIKWAINKLIPLSNMSQKNKDKWSMINMGWHDLYDDLYQALFFKLGNGLTAELQENENYIFIIGKEEYKYIGDKKISICIEIDITDISTYYKNKQNNKGE